MSRIGKLPIVIPAGVTVTISGNEVKVKGPKGELEQTVSPEIKVEMVDGEIHVTRPNDEKQTRALHGLYRALIHNMVVGVSEGYKKELELVGVGYRAQSQGQVLELSLGYSHAIFLRLPAEIKVSRSWSSDSRNTSTGRRRSSSACPQARVFQTLSRSGGRSLWGQAHRHPDSRACGRQRTQTTRSSRPRADR